MTETKTYKRTLDNGLEVWVDPRPIGKTAAFLIFNSGSAANNLPETAHLLEHIQGVSAKVYGEEDTLEYCKRNANTNFDKTLYYFCDFLPEHLPFALENLSRVLSKPDYRHFEREKKAVKNELLPQNNELNLFRIENAKILYPIRSKYLNHMSQRLDSLETLTEDNCTEFWNDNYAPDNAILYIGGEFKNFEQELNLFSQKPKRTHLPIKEDWGKEPFLEKRIERTASISNNPGVEIGIALHRKVFPKDISIEQGIAQQLIEAYLDNNSGPLYRSLRDESNLIYSLDVSLDGLAEAGMIRLFTKSYSIDNLGKIESVWNQTLHEIAEKGIPERFLKNLNNMTRVKIPDKERNFDVSDIISEFRYGVSLEKSYSIASRISQETIKEQAADLTNRHPLVTVLLPKSQQ